MAEEKVEKVVYEMRVLDDGEGNFRVEMKGNREHLKGLHRHGFGPWGHRAFRHHMHGFRHGRGYGYGYGPYGLWGEEDEPVDA